MLPDAEELTFDPIMLVILSRVDQAWLDVGHNHSHCAGVDEVLGPTALPYTNHGHKIQAHFAIMAAERVPALGGVVPIQAGNVLSLAGLLRNEAFSCELL
jgi:hypothetical protein